MSGTALAAGIPANPRPLASAILAGVHLTEMPAGEREKIVQDHARDPRWRWIFRFALSWTEREQKSETLVQLARDLIRYGNPLLVYDALDAPRSPWASKREESRYDPFAVTSPGGRGRALRPGKGFG